MMRKIIETKYTVYNKLVATKYWIHASILLGELISLHDYHEQKWTLSASWDFYVSTNYIKEWVWLSRYNQQTAINTLEEAWLISVYLENNNLRYFHLNEDKICEITWFNGGAKNWHPLSEINTPCQKLAGGWEWVAGGWEKTAPINKEYIINNKNNIYKANKNFCNTESVLPTDGECVKTELEHNQKNKRKTKKEQRRDEILSSTDFNNTLHEWITSPEDIEDIDTLRRDFIELRCSKDYRAITDWAVRRNLKVLQWTSPVERKAILEKAVTKWWTGLFPLNDYDKQRIKDTHVNTEWSDERIIKTIYETNCKEREEEIQDWTTHNLIVSLCDKYWEDRIKKLYYDKVKPQVDSRYSIKRDWK